MPEWWFHLCTYLCTADLTVFLCIFCRWISHLLVQFIHSDLVVVECTFNQNAKKLLKNNVYSWKRIVLVLWVFIGKNVCTVCGIYSLVKLCYIFPRNYLKKISVCEWSCCGFEKNNHVLSFSFTSMICILNAIFFFCSLYHLNASHHPFFLHCSPPSPSTQDPSILVTSHSSCTWLNCHCKVHPFQCRQSGTPSKIHLLHGIKAFFHLKKCPKSTTWLLSVPVPSFFCWQIHFEANASLQN